MYSVNSVLKESLNITLFVQPTEHTVTVLNYDDLSHLVSVRYEKPDSYYHTTSNSV